MNAKLKNAIITNKLKTSALNGWYTIDPVFAMILLELNVKNYRKLDKSRVRKYASDMKAGLWRKNGEPIIISEGILVDGQHRLHAVVESGKSIEAQIVFDATETDVLDCGSSRTIGNLFNAEGKPASALLVAIGRIILKLGTKNDSPGNGVVHDYVDEHFEDFKFAESIASSSGTVAKKASCAALAYALKKNGEVSEADMKTFFKIVNTGNTAGYDGQASPALVLRNQILAVKGGGQAWQKILLEITYKALKDFVNGTSRSRNYKWDCDDAERLIRETYISDKNRKRAA